MINLQLRKRLTSLLLILALLLCSCAYTQQAAEIANSSQPTTFLETYNDLSIVYLNVGQGDCELITLPNKETMIIDAGTREQGEHIVQTISDLGWQELTYAVATHPHADHIGGFEYVFDTYPPQIYYAPDITHNTDSFGSLESKLEELYENGVTNIETASAGKVIINEAKLKVEFLSPFEQTYRDLNEYSAIVKITYNDTRFLFMGDATKNNEYQLISSGVDINADVIKIGHHGSRTSTSNEFIEKAAPEYAVISSGHMYGHPHIETIATLESNNVNIYRTDEENVEYISATSDGHSITLEVIKTEISTNAPNDFDELDPTDNSSVVYRTKTGKKYHTEDCYMLKSKIKTTVKEAKELGLEPCKICNPPDE